MEIEVLSFKEKVDLAKNRALMILAIIPLFLIIFFMQISSLLIIGNNFLYNKLHNSFLSKFILPPVLPAICGLIAFGVFAWIKNSPVTSFFWGIVFFHWTLLGSSELEGTRFEDINMIIGLIIFAIGLVTLFFSIPSTGLIIYGSVLVVWSCAKGGTGD